MSADEFKPLKIDDKRIFNRHLGENDLQSSELTFTNLFMWRHRYRPLWLAWENCLLIIMRPKGEPPFALPPIGAGDRRKALGTLVEELKRFTPEVKICRVDEDFVKEYVNPDRYDCLPDRDNSDYVYLTQDLIHLKGRKYHRKKNHLNQFIKDHDFEYRPLDMDLVEDFLNMQESWCEMRACVDSPDLLSEDYAIHEALASFEELDYRGGAIIIDSKVEGFSLGEPLNRDTAVIHTEKANPGIRGLYVAVNQLFCVNAWSEMKYINREQDLGIEGLRKAKESYHPHHMVNKYTLRPR